MTYRTIQADVQEFKDRLVIIKSDEIDHQTIRAVSDSFKKKGFQGIVVMGLGANDSIETMTKDQARYLLNKILETPEATT